MWGQQHALALYGSPTNSVFHVIRDSIPPSDPDDGAENPYPGNYDPAQWTNIRYEVDIAWHQLGLPGLVWNLSSTVDTNFGPADRKPADGYIFYITPGSSNGFTGSSANCVLPAYQSTWHLARVKGWDRLGNISGQQDWVELANGPVVAKMPGTETAATLSTTSLQCLRTGRAFRFRLDWMYPSFRVQYLMPWGDTPGVDTLYYGCASAAAPTGICTDANIDDCWCEILQGPVDSIDPSPITTPGMVGFYRSQLWTFLSPSWEYKHDNLRISDLGPGGSLVCDPWQGWAHERTDIVPFKYLYEGALFDYSAGRHIQPAPELGKIDVNTEAPVFDSSYNGSIDSNPYCNGWNLLEDLPGPTDSTNLSAIRTFLEPMTSAVQYESNSGFSWVDSFDNDPASPDYDPVPMIADGTTPINGSLLEAFDWYVDQKTTGAWATDSYEDCRNWWVVLITDGEEGCEFEACAPAGVGDCPANGFKPDPDKVCDPGEAASKFADPGIPGVPPLPVYTIGFSESVAEDSPLSCIAEQTGGLFLTAEDAGQLSEALYQVFYRLEAGTRSFVPFKVAPPPPSTGGEPSLDSLAIFPLFQPQEGFTLWGGSLYGFALNEAQPTLPTTGDCELDTDELVWDASERLAEQLAAHTEGNPKRFVYMGSDSTGEWARHDLATLPDNATLRSEFWDHLNRPGAQDDVLSQQIANFVRNIYMDNDFTAGNAGPPAEPRPTGYPVYGEFYHSQPLIVNPPNTPTYYYDYGYGASSYVDFMTKQAKRRRMILVGGNDGMLHFFDGGVWDRDRVDTTEDYHLVHDLGTGTELAAWVPQAIMHRLYDLTSGGGLDHIEPQYMVDGPITKSDAFIDSDGDGDREWRTVAITTMRRGGRGMAAFDITQPDPIGASPDYLPEVSEFAGCRVGSISGCDGEWPRLMWEFKDELDQDTNCLGGLSGDDCAPWWDLGWTWSKPAIARIAVYNSSDPSDPDDVFVAFFGGGWDETDSDATGTFFYGVDLETGTVLVKEAIGVDVPGGVTALDSDIDGFHDRIYFGDSHGRIFRLQYLSPTDVGQTGATAGTLTDIFNFQTDFVDRQEFFTKPTLVPVVFDGTGYTWALAMGSGDRADLARDDSGIDHFFFVMDVGDTTTRGEADLVEMDYSSLVFSDADLDDSLDFVCPDGSVLNPTGGDYGWYLTLRDTEKVVFDSTVIDGYVLFPTFDPSTDTATNAPNQCGSGTGSTTEVDVVCRATGIGRTYKLWYECGIGEYTEHNDIITGSEDYSIGGDTYVTFTGTTDGPGETEEFPLIREHSVTNWRQE